MGDRGVVLLKFPYSYPADLAVYSHWTGSQLLDECEAIVATPAFRGRVADEQYAARILVDQLTKEGRDNEAGFGIFPVPRGTDPSSWSDGVTYATVDLMTGDVTEGFYVESSTVLG